MNYKTSAIAAQAALLAAAALASPPLSASQAAALALLDASLGFAPEPRDSERYRNNYAYIKYF